MAASGCGLLLDAAPDDGGGDPLPAVEAGAADGGPRDAASDTGPLDGGPADAPVDSGIDVGPVECVTPMDCTTTYGPPPCGAWACTAFACEVICAGCSDADHDGYGVGSGCAGGDCDDADDTIGPNASMPCYTGPAGTAGVGECRSGTMDCHGGVWTTCLGSVGPSGESCNGRDDDCDGHIDDDLGTISCGLGACTTSTSVCSAGMRATCVAPLPISSEICSTGIDEDCDGRVDEGCPDCIWVSPTGSDASSDPRMPSSPYATIQHAIDSAVRDATLPRRVCLLSPSCMTTATFSGPVTMAQGIAVQGNYGLDVRGIPTRCVMLIRTAIDTGTPEGVLFPSTITGGLTELSDVAITPHTSPTSSRVSTGITVDGARGVMIRGVVVNTTAATVTDGVGIDVRNGGEALITRSVVFAPSGTREAIGVRALNARVEIRDNCDGFDRAGRCNMGCGFGRQGVRGRLDTMGMRATTSYAILLRNAPGSVVSGTATCGSVADRSADIRIDGNAAGIILRGNFVGAWGGEYDGWGVDLFDCGGAAPWIGDNFTLHGEGGSNAPQGAIRSRGDCHPVIEGNLRIASGLEGHGMPAHGVLCGVTPGGGARAAACSTETATSGAVCTAIPRPRSACVARVARARGSSET